MRWESRVTCVTPEVTCPRLQIQRGVPLSSVQNAVPVEVVSPQRSRSGHGTHFPLLPDTAAGLPGLPGTQGPQAARTQRPRGLRSAAPTGAPNNPASS